MTNKEKWADIVEANKSIKTIPLKGKEYAEVNQRIKAFRMLYPEGTIIVEKVLPDDPIKEGYVLMKATVMDYGVTLASDMAFEERSSSFVNKTSFIENCSTSAVGRALGMCGFGIDTSVASFEEVKNAIETQEGMETISKVQAKSIIDLAGQKGVSGEDFLSHFGVKKSMDLTTRQYAEAVKWLDEMEDA